MDGVFYQIVVVYVWCQEFGVRSLRLGVIIVILVSSLVVFEFLVSFDFEEVYLLIDILMKRVILLLLLYLLNWMYCDCLYFVVRQDYLFVLLLDCLDNW